MSNPILQPSTVKTNPTPTGMPTTGMSTTGMQTSNPVPPTGTTTFQPTIPQKVPLNVQGMPTTGFPTGIMGMTAEPFNVYEPEPYSYRNVPGVNVGNVFGPTNPMTMGSMTMPPMMSSTMPMMPMMPPTVTNPMLNATNPLYPAMTTMHGSQTLYNMNFRPANWIEFYTLTNPVRIVDRDGSRILFLAYDMRGYKPEEISVTMQKGDRSIIVEANYEFKDNTHMVNRKFYRKFVLPDYLKNVDLNKVDLHSSLNINGMLMIEAMLPRMTPEEMSKFSGEMHAHNVMPSMTGGYPTMMPGYNVPVTCRPVM